MKTGTPPATTLALGALVLGALAVLGWVLLAGGELHGTVKLVGCGGAAPVGSPATCSRTAVGGAIVIAVARGQRPIWTAAGGGRFVLESPAPTTVESARADSAGTYRLSLPAGDYLVGAKFENWVRDEGNGIHTTPFSAAGTFYPVRVNRLSRTEFDLAIIFNAP